MQASALCLLIPLAALAQQLTCSKGKCVQVFSGSAAIGRQLRVNTQGPVTLQAGTSHQLAYTAKVTVRAWNETEARRILQGYSIRVSPEGAWNVLAVPAGPLVSTALELKTAPLASASIITLDGGVEVAGVDGNVDITSGAGAVSIDRIRGSGRLITRGGAVNVGTIDGDLRANSGSGSITARSIRGLAVIQTLGGDITAHEVGGPLRAETGAGTIKIDKAGATVDAVSGGGQIWVGSAKGRVSARSMAGQVHVGSAAGVICRSGAGGVNLSAVNGAMQVTTTVGSIAATMLGGAAESYLATGNGDITIRIPSNVGVTILAESDMADTLRRITSEFPQIQARRDGRRVVAEGAVNGGGPLLRVSAAAGTIFIKRQ
jgi:hypothetical protein